jgi:putative inorganic carbon (hco3(-)) transporter
MRRTGTYLIFSLALWVFLPEVRRLMDWKVGFQAINILSIVPLLSLVPLAVGALRRWQRVPPLMQIVAWLWIGAFVYSFVVAFTSGDIFSGAYTFVEFTLPLAAGLWASTVDEPLPLFKRFAGAAFLFAALSSLYGIIQYVVVPQWDAYWLQNAGIGSAGKPEPYQVRVWGTLNAPGPFAFYLMIALILAIGGAGIRSLRAAAQMGVTIVAFALSLVRSAWLALAVGIVTYIVLSPRPLRAFATLAATAAISVVFLVNLPAIVGDQGVNDNLTKRFSTLQDVGSDESANDRQSQVQNAWDDVQARPLGAGLGTVGTATKLSSSGAATTLDSGYLSRLTEMGFPGFAGYLGAIVLALLATLRTLFASRDAPTRALAATSAAVQMALIGMDLSGDSHLNLSGMLSWTLAGLTLAAYRRRAEQPQPARPVRLARTPA